MTMTDDGRAMSEDESSGQRPTWAEIDLDALASNFREARRRAEEGAEWFGVATPEEAVELRGAGVRGDVLSFGGFWEGQAAVCVRQKITPVLYRLDVAQALDRAAR